MSRVTRPAAAGWEWLFIDRPRLGLAIMLLVTAVCGLYATDIRLDASGESLMLEHDADLQYYRAITARYGSDDYLVITYSTQGDLFSAASLADLKRLRDALRELEGFESVISILDVPLIESPPTTLRELQTSVPTLLSKGTDIELARKELTTSPLYRQLLMSVDGQTTALLARFRLDDDLVDQLAERDKLREQQVFGELEPAQLDRLDALDESIRVLRAQLNARQQADIARVREILDQHRDRAELHLGGLPMIVADMLTYVQRDILVFGIGILIFLIGLLTLIFRRPRWVVLSLLTCFAAIVVELGWLGALDWPLTVVSANFVALLLIFGLSITVHLIVRYRELHAEHPGAGQRELVCAMVSDKFMPSLYTALTTMIAFASFLISGIRPVIDFGWMMVVGMAVLMIMAFTIFPAGLMLLQPGKLQAQRETTSAVIDFLARLVERRPAWVMMLYLLLIAATVFGLTRLSIENRFIDNFKSSTEIYRGMVKIDQELGGTTPLDIILDADPAYLAQQQNGDPADDEFDDPFADDFGSDGGDLGSTSYWYNTFQLQRVREVHDYIDSLPETGKVLSMATTIETLRTINDDETVTTFWLSILYKQLPEQIKALLFDPYLSKDGNQVRISVRVFETDPNLHRQELLTRIHTHLVDDMGFAPERVHLTGMLVLYNNVLQSLFRSQILTLGFVFSAILVMFLALYRSLRLGLIAIVPNLLAAGAVLGVMGLLSISLDIMTITIAAIVVGIGVDDTIHYLHRFRRELAVDGDFVAAMERSHHSIGRAMFYTSVIITVGFSILVLSEFWPTVYFGALTGFAMLLALLANLTLLPVLLLRIRPQMRG